MTVYQNKHTKALITERDYNCLSNKQKEEMEKLNVDGVEESGHFPDFSIFTKEDKERLLNRNNKILLEVGQN